MKKLINKTISSVTLVVACIIVNTTPIAYANEIDSEFISSNQSYTLKENLYPFQGITLKLLDTFDSDFDIIAKYQEKYTNYLNSIRDKYSLAPLSIETATEYKNSVIVDTQSNDKDIEDLVAFLDFYENPKENQIIINQLEELNRQVFDKEISSYVAIAQARTIVPINQYNQNARPFYPDRSVGINLASARSYAARHATHRNPSFDGFGNNDCTNFASQILSAGMARMDFNLDKNKGWWWSSRNSQSISWIRAQSFKTYWGSGYSGTDWFGFIANVQNGDFIGLDYGNDGTIDHIGFVYEKQQNRLKIAQHSSDYLSWNGNWPNYSHKGKYYRICR